MALTLLTAPTIEPVTLVEAKSHLRVDLTDDDQLITNLIIAARQYAETFLRRQLVTATWEFRVDSFPGIYSWGLQQQQSQWAILLPLPPVQSISSITYIDTNGVTQTLDPTKYIVDAKTEPGRITPAFGEIWPPTRWQVNAVTVTFVAGYGVQKDVPEAIKMAIKQLIAHWYENREAAMAAPPATVPMAVESLLWSYRWGNYL